MASVTGSHATITARDGAADAPSVGRLALPTVTALFFMWGFLTSLNDILIPHLRGVFSLSYTQAALVQFTFFGAYFLTALPWGKLVARVGYQAGIVVGLVVAGAGAALFVPAASTLRYGVFLAALFVLAAGITLLQVAANPYVAVLGPDRTASSRLVLTQAFNSLGTTVAPVVGGLLILGGAEAGPTSSEAERLATAGTVKGPYLALALTLLALAVVMWRARLPRIAAAEEGTGSATPARHAWQVPHLVLGAIGIFVYVGAEVAIGSFLINFFGLPNVAGLAERDAAHLVAYYWGAAMVGRFIGAALLRTVDAGALLAGCALAAAALTGVAVVTDGQVAMWSILAVGLFNSIMFPTIFTLAIRGLGARTSEGSSLLVMAIVGGALIPLAHGALADRIGLQPAFLLPAVCYLYIVYYGIRGSRVDDAALA